MLSAAFWGGLWGIVFALLRPQFGAGGRYWIAALLFGAIAPTLVMTYWNPVVRMGVDEFARRLAEAGGAGLITPDLVPDEVAKRLKEAHAR